MAPGLLTVVAALGVSLTLCLVMLMLAVVFFRKDPLCCKFRPDRTEHRSDEPHHYHSRHSLITITPAEPNPISPGAAGPQLSGRLFIIGKPNDYYLSGGLPRLPSYESVRKKDRQRQIHHMISQRFGLFPNEPPPPYEETLHQSAETSLPNPHTLDVHLSVQDHDDSSHLHGDTNITNHPSSSLQDSQPSCSRAHSFMFSPSDGPAGPYQTM